MFKKIFAAACITCLALSVVGCSNKTTDSVSDNSVTPTDAVVSDNSIVTVLDKYEAGDIAAIANTGVEIGKTENFTGDANNEIFAQVCYGTKPDGVNTYDSSDVTFYIFNNNEDADAAFQYIKDNIVQPSAQCKDNYIYGVDKNAVDIIVKHLYYKDLNLIVYKTVYMGDPGNMFDSHTDNDTAEVLNEWKSIWNVGTID